MVVACEVCKKEFDTAQAMEQHKKDAHGIGRPAVVKKKSKKWIIIGVLVVIVLAGAAYIAFSRPAYEPGPRELHVKGNGTVEIVEFSDFQCPACGVAYQQAKVFMQTAGDSVRFVYKHYPIAQLHPFAFKAAEASECAADQGKFWEYHDRLFENQQALQSGNLITYAQRLGLATATFTACLNSGVMAVRVIEDMAEADRLGVGATPTFFINGRKIEGVLTPAQFAQEAGI